MSYDQASEAGDVAALQHARLRGATEGEGVSRETQRARLQAELGASMADDVIEQVEISVKYAGYIHKQNAEVDRAAFYEGLRLPDDLDYMAVSALSIEARQKLSKHRPETLGQASRISGITPAAISLLLIHLKKGRFKGFASVNEAGEVLAKESM